MEVNGDNNQTRFKYAHNQLEIMAPSSRHEFIKKAIGILLETYFLEKSIRYYPLGSTTFRSEPQQKGIKPDQCYCLHSRKDTSDLAIEVVITSGGLNSLEIYQSLEVAEVWFWKNEELSLYTLRNNQYQKINQSLLLPGLNVNQFSQWILYDEVFDAIYQLRQTYR